MSTARDRLNSFVPKAAQPYAQLRNFDLGPGCHAHVSTLSPYLKIRALDEPTVARAVVAAHPVANVEKFLAELFWRTYWKGWMENRPDVWDQYLRDLNTLRDDLQSQSGLRARWGDACLGRTGIAPFDDWANELVETGYLHNHARMWFASIWVFTLGLPWQLGADFFLRHLLDGDVAVNTLSWRWVCGIQTCGKTYLASPENIAKFTNQRYPAVTGLARKATQIAAPPAVDVRGLRPCDPPVLASRYGILLHDEDVGFETMLQNAPDPHAVGFADAAAGHSPWHMAAHVGTFRRRMAQDAAGHDAALAPLSTTKAIADWAADQHLEQIIAPFAPTGPVATLLASYRNLSGAAPLFELRRPLDSVAWPLATKGFFPFRKHIPNLLERFAQP